MTLKLIKESITKYDIMAIAFERVSKEIHTIKRVNDQIETIINDYFDSCDTEGETVAFQELKFRLLHEFDQREFGYDDYHSILILFDNMEFDKRELKGSFRFSEFKSLNSNYKETGVYVLPYFNDRFIDNISGIQSNTFRNSTKDNRISCLNLINYQIFHRDAINEINISFVKINDNDDMSSSIKKKGYVKIAVAPVRFFDIEKLLISEKDSERINFIGFHDDFEKEHSTRAIETLKTLLDEDNDFIIFPELLLTPSILTKASDVIKSKKIKHSKIIVLGTISQEGVNKCYVYDQRGKEILTQTKKLPYINSEGIAEYLIVDENVKILEIDGVGRVLIVICIDINYIQYNNLCSLLKIDFILVVSFSKSLDLLSRCKALSMDKQIICVLANSCSALFSKDADFIFDHKIKISDKCKIGGIVTPAKLVTERDAETYHYGMDDKCKFCDTVCPNKRIRIMSEIRQHETVNGTKYVVNVVVE